MRKIAVSHNMQCGETVARLMNISADLRRLQLTAGFFEQKFLDITIFFFFYQV